MVVVLKKNKNKTPKRGRLDLNVKDSSHVLVFGFLMLIIMHKKNGMQIKRQEIDGMQMKIQK